MKKLLVVLVIVVVAIPVLIKHRYGGGEHFPAIAVSQVSFDSGALEIVANLPEPPGNIAVSDDGRVFFTFHPEGRPSLKVAEWVGGEAKAWPSVNFQTGEGEARYFQNVLSLRIDQQGRLWTLDNAHHGLGQPRLLAFDIDSGEVVHE